MARFLLIQSIPSFLTLFFQCCMQYCVIFDRNISSVHNTELDVLWALYCSPAVAIIPGDMAPSPRLWTVHVICQLQEGVTMNMCSAVRCCNNMLIFLQQWCHQMETFSAPLAFCAGNSLVIGEFLAHRPMTRSFNVLFDLRLNKLLSK